MYKNSNCSISSSIFDVSLLNFGLICISLVTNDVGHYFMYFFAFHIIFCEGLFKQLFSPFLFYFFIVDIWEYHRWISLNLLDKPMPCTSEPRVQKHFCFWRWLPCTWKRPVHLRGKSLFCLVLPLAQYPWALGDNPWEWFDGSAWAWSVTELLGILLCHSRPHETIEPSLKSCLISPPFPCGFLLHPSFCFEWEQLQLSSHPWRAHCFLKIFSI